eukprot:8581757-Karenia_brevis.AAC.1
MTESRTMKGLHYVSNEEGRCVLFMAAHVDDVISVCEPAYQHILGVFSRKMISQRMSLARTTLRR